MSNSNLQTIPVFVLGVSEETKGRFLDGKPANIVVGQITEVSKEAFKDDFKALVITFNEVLFQLSQEAANTDAGKSGWDLTELTVELGLNAQGKLGIIGLGGVQAGVAASISVKFTRGNTD